MTFYKAVRKTDSGYKSVFIGSKMTGNCNISIRAPKYELTYKPNEWTLPHPETNGIYVFKEDYQASDFICKLLVTDSIEIWKCKVIDPICFSKIAEIDEEEIEIFWNDIKNNTDRGWSKTSPDGSYLVKQCMITERVSY